MEDRDSPVTDESGTVEQSCEQWRKRRHEVNLDCILTDESIHDKAQSALQALKKLSLCTEAESLAAPIGDEIDSFKNRIMPAILHHGIQSLPDEVLSDILVRDTYEYEFYDKHYPILPRAVLLARTCKQFRRVIWSTGECWTRVSNMYMQKMSISRVKFQLDTFKNVPIDLAIASEAKCTVPLLETVLLTREYRTRIRSVHWSWVIRNSDDGPFPIPEDLCRARLVFSNVTSLRIIAPIWEWSPWWSFPQLKYLECDSAPPEKWSPLLRTWKPYGWYPDIKLRRLHPFLATALRLRSLHLDLTHYCGWFRDFPRSPISLSELEYLKIYLDERYFNIRRLEDQVFLETVKFPKLRRVEFYGRGTHLFPYCFAPDIELPTVETLTLRGAISPLPLDYVHNMFPCLQYLDIQTEHRVLWLDQEFTPRYLPCGKLTVKLSAEDKFWLRNIQALFGYRAFGTRVAKVEVTGKHIWFMSRIESLVRPMLSLALPMVEIQVDPLIGALHSEIRSLEILLSEVEKEFGQGADT